MLGLQMIRNARGWVWTLVFASPMLGAEAPEESQDDDSADKESIIARLSSLRGLEVGTEVLWASDIQISETSLLYRQTTASWEWSLSGFLNTFDEDYRPVPLFDPIGFKTDLTERTWGNQLTLRKQFNPSFALTAAGGYYDGFDGYRSIWLDEYYRQQFSFVPGYEDADPWGANGAGGFVWEYVPANATLEAGISYNRDVVAPGYEIETDPITGAFAGLRRGRDSLDTVSYRVLTENVLSRRMLSKVEGVVTDTTDRELRFAVQGSLNVAAGDRWVWRGEAGYTMEDPTFDSWFIGAALEYEALSGLYLYVAGHYYEDTGEILNALQLSSSAPGLEAWNVGGGARYAWSQASIKLFVGPYFTDYEPVEMGTAPFGHLYQDRSWWLAQFALSVQL